MAGCACAAWKVTGSPTCRSSASPGGSRPGRYQGYPDRRRSSVTDRTQESHLAWSNDSLEISQTGWIGPVINAWATIKMRDVISYKNMTRTKGFSLDETKIQGNLKVPDSHW